MDNCLIGEVSMAKYDPKEDSLGYRDKQHLPVTGYKEYLYDDELGEQRMKLYNIYNKDGDLLCNCPSMRLMKYVVTALNTVYLHKKVGDLSRELRDKCLGMFVVDGEVVPKDDKWYPYKDKDGVVRFRKSREYRLYVNSVLKDKTASWYVDTLEQAQDVNMYIVVLFYVKSDCRLDIGQCINTVTDILKESGIISAKRNSKLIGVARAQIVPSLRQRTEVFIMKHSDRSK